MGRAASSGVAKKAAGRRPPAALAIEPDQHALLRKWSRSRVLPARVVSRSRIVLMRADGLPQKTVARALGVAAGTVRLWERRFVTSGPESLRRDAPGRGRKPVLEASVRQALRVAADDSDHSGVRARARELGVSPSTISRWRRRS